VIIMAYNRSKTVYEHLTSLLPKGRLHFTLIDPAAQSPEEAANTARVAEEVGSDVILLGGSTGASQLLDATGAAIREACSLPVVLFPGNVDGITPNADAVLFMSLLNSMNHYWVIGAQALGAPTIKRMGIEPIPMGYIVVEPGGTVGWVGEAKLMPRSKPELAACYALAAQYMGMRLVYLEAGSGADAPIPAEMIAAVRGTIDIPIIVGGGIRTPEHARNVVKAGADIVVTGTVLEEKGGASETFKQIVAAVKGT